MAIEPKNVREHIVALYGHITGVKKDLYQIKNNHLKHMHDDIDKLDKKVDNIIWATLAAAFTTILTLVGLFNLFLN